MADNDTLDKVLAIGSSANGIEPLWSLLTEALGLTRPFTVDFGQMTAVEAMLQAKGLRARNGFVTGDKYCFDAAADSAPLVALLLRQHFGVEFVHKPRWLTHPRRRRTRRNR